MWDTADSIFYNIVKWNNTLLLLANADHKPILSPSCPDRFDIFLVSNLWFSYYSRTRNTGSDEFLTLWVTQFPNGCHGIDVNKAQGVSLNTAWTGTAWCLNSTTWTVLSSEIYWHLGFPRGKFPACQCQLTHLSEEHLIISLYIRVWINAFDFADNWLCSYWICLLCWGS